MTKISGPLRNWVAGHTATIVVGTLTIVLATVFIPLAKQYAIGSEITGTITSPKNGETVSRKFNLTGFVENYSSGSHFWLADEDGHADMLWPHGVTDLDIIEPNGKWVSSVTQYGNQPGDTFNLVLVSVDDESHKEIIAWTKTDRSQGIATQDAGKILDKILLVMSD